MDKAVQIIDESNEKSYEDKSVQCQEPRIRPKHKRKVIQISNNKKSYKISLINSVEFDNQDIVKSSKISE